MRILTVGGGSGGHVTPVAAVCKQLQRLHPDAEIRFWCDRAFLEQAKLTMQAVDEDMIIETIIAGKLRRYHKMGLWRQLLRVRTIVLPNLIDGVKLTVGLGQSIVKLLMWRPDVVFTKGGFVCLPVGLAAKLLGVPLVIHDSDAHPGLTNRILGRYAETIATGAPLKYYNYPRSRSHYIGIPVEQSIKPYDHDERVAAKKQLGFNEHDPLVLITGGGLGASNLNNAVLAVLDDLTAFTSVILIAGKAHEADLKAQTKKKDKTRLQIYGYVPASDMLNMMAAADVVVTRAGATTLLELAALAKPSVIVPNEYLTGGHQTKNAAVYEQADAAVVLEERHLVAEPLALVDAINATMLNKRHLARLSKNIHAFSKPHAAKTMAELIIKAIKA